MLRAIFWNTEEKFDEGIGETRELTERKAQPPPYRVPGHQPWRVNNHCGRGQERGITGTTHFADGPVPYLTAGSVMLSIDRRAPSTGTESIGTSLPNTVPSMLDRRIPAEAPAEAKGRRILDPPQPGPAPVWTPKRPGRLCVSAHDLASRFVSKRRLSSMCRERSG